MNAAPTPARPSSQGRGALVRRLQRYLEPGERVLWTGGPHTRLVWRWQLLFVAANALAVVLLTGWLVWPLLFGSLPNGEEPRGNPLMWIIAACAFGLMFGVGMASGLARWLLDGWRRRRTLYAVTDRNAVLLRRAFGETIITKALTPDVPVGLFDGPHGTAAFGPLSGNAPPDHRGMGGWNGDGFPLVFERVDNVEALYRLVREIQAGHAGRS